MRIVVLVKPVPDTASGGERLRPDDWRLDRAAVPAVVNANDEYALEAALKLTEAHGGEVHLVSMAGPNAPETMRTGRRPSLSCGRASRAQSPLPSRARAITRRWICWVPS